MKKYAVIVKNIDQLESLYSDMEHSGAGKSNCCPERQSICSCRKPSSRVTYYQLTEQEAELLKQDPRIESVELSIEEQNIIPKLIYEQNGIFSKLPSSNNHKNWGLLYSSNNGNYIPSWGSGTATEHVEATIDFDNNSLGEGVDIVIVDGGVDFNHPEFALNADGTGGSRFVQYDWFQHDLAVKGTAQTTTYNYNSDIGKSHGTHVAGIAAGNTQGWAKKANIYNINIYDNQISSTFIFDYIKAFHNSKNGTRPTVVNCSFQYVIGSTLDFNDCAFRIMSKGPVHVGGIETVPFDKNNPYIHKEITNVHYQGTDYNERFVFGFDENGLQPRCERATYSDGIFRVEGECCEEITDTDCWPKGGGYCPCQNINDGVNNTICLQDVGFDMCPPNSFCYSSISSTFTYDSIDYFYNIGWPVYVSQIDADVADAVSAGVIVIAAAGNDARYIADQNNINYNNRIDIHESSSLYYMRRASPATNASLVVGALGTQRRTNSRYAVQKSEIANFSNKGPGVDIWAPGMNIMSADFGSVDNISTFEDPRNSTFTVGSKSGTSMASPQIAGILACNLSSDNTINSSNVKDYLLNNSRQNEIRLGWGKPRPIGEGPHFSAVDPLSSDSREILNFNATAYGDIVPAPLSINFINQQFVYAGQSGPFSPNFVLDNIANKQKIRRIYTFSGSNNSNILRWSPDDAFSQFSSLGADKLYWVESLASNFENNIIENVIANTVSDNLTINSINQFLRYSLQDAYPLNNLDTSVKQKIRRIYTFSGPNNSNILRWSPNDLFSQFSSLEPNKLYWIESLDSNFASYVLLSSPTPTASPSPTPSATPSPTPSATPSPTPSPTPTASPTPTPTASLPPSLITENNEQIVDENNNSFIV